LKRFLILSMGFFMMKILRLLLIVVFLLTSLLVSLAQEEGMATINLGSNDELGEFIVGDNGMTLYIYTRDPIGETVCYDRCAENWPPLIVESEDDLTVAEGIPGVFGTVERTNGDLNVTYNDMPLYYWRRDEAPGDSTGQNVGGVWWVIAPGDVYLQYTEELGHILVGTEGLSLYVFLNDESGSGESACVDQCAENWPPLIVESEEVVGDPRLPGELGTIERTDGSLQVTYDGWPLYYWKDDTAVGDTTGEGRGDVWYTVSPPLLLVAESEDLGQYLVDAVTGKAVYIFTNDEVGAGASNCTETCLENWPELRLYGNDRLVAGEGVMGELGSFVRADNDRQQITYNGMPLYFFAEDAEPSDINGQGRGDVWFVVEP
jgi:predicted lipoprotein with Yx(FWY)xxD motif